MPVVDAECTVVECPEPDPVPAVTVQAYAQLMLQCRIRYIHGIRLRIITQKTVDGPHKNSPVQVLHHTLDPFVRHFTVRQGRRVHGVEVVHVLVPEKQAFRKGGDPYASPAVHIYFGYVSVGPYPVPVGLHQIRESHRLHGTAVDDADAGTCGADP